MKDSKRIEYLLSTFPDYIKNVEIIWECQWQGMKETLLKKDMSFAKVLKLFQEQDGGLILREENKGCILRNN